LSALCDSQRRPLQRVLWLQMRCSIAAGARLRNWWLFDGETRQLVEVKLNVVHVERKPDEPKLLTNVLTNPEKHNDINATYLSATERAVERRQGRQVIPPEGSGPSSGRGRGKFWQGDPVKTTLDSPLRSWRPAIAHNSDDRDRFRTGCAGVTEYTGRTKFFPHRTRKERRQSH
jgi:hypothetical protein